MPKERCFFVAPIGEKGSDRRKHSDLVLNYIVKPIAQTNFGYEVFRADGLPQPGMIGDQIIREIIQAELVIADFSFLNANVFYEVGLRHMAGGKAIHLASTTTPLPFDNISHRTIFFDIGDFDSHENARKELKEQITSIRDKNYVVSNPVTQAKAAIRLAASSDPNEKIVAQIQEELREMRAQMSRLRATSDLALSKTASYDFTSQAELAAIRNLLAHSSSSANPPLGSIFGINSGSSAKSIYANSLPTQSISQLLEEDAGNPRQPPSQGSVSESGKDGDKP